MNGKSVIFSAPSGSGKTTIVKCLVSKDLNLEFSISATSREPRIGETDGIDYYFLTAEEFRKRIDNGEFIEWEEVYKDHYYGTLKSELERIWSRGNHVIFDVDVVGGLALKKIFGDRSASFFVKAPSVNTLRQRLLLRGTDPKDKIEMRIEKAEEELKRSPEFDHIIINDNLKNACDETEMIVKKFLEDK
jgi:guanylate kinase